VLKLPECCNVVLNTWCYALCVTVSCCRAWNPASLTRSLLLVAFRKAATASRSIPATAPTIRGTVKAIFQRREPSCVACLRVVTLCCVLLAWYTGTRADNENRSSANIAALLFSCRTLQKSALNATQALQAFLRRKPNKRCVLFPVMLWSQLRFDYDTTATRLRRKIDMFIVYSRWMEAGARDTS